MKHRKHFTRFDKIQINNSTQAVLVRGKNTDAPLLIHVQAGPGFPLISEANKMEKLLHLEKHFPGKSFNLFEHSAHTPQYEEPEHFSKLIMSHFNKTF